MIRKTHYILLFSMFMTCANAFSCIIMQNNADESLSYLDRINKKTTEPKIKKLESIRNNITKYLKDTNKKELPEPKIQIGATSSYQTIPKATFDTIFMNIYNISKLYMSYNVDRIIFEMQSGKRLVYYIKNKDDREKIDNLVNLIPNKIKIIIINDVYKIMDDPFGYLYCDPK